MINEEEVLKSLWESEEPDAPEQHRAKTRECLSLGLLDRLLARTTILTDEQLEHIAQCAGFCQRNLTHLRKYGEQNVRQLAKATVESFNELVEDSRRRLGSLSESLTGFGESAAAMGLVLVFEATGLVGADKKPRRTYPVLIENTQVKVLKGNCVVTQGPWVKDGRLIARLTFELPKEFHQRHPIQLLFVGKDGEIFNAIDLPGIEEQLINVELPAPLPDHTLQPTDPLPCALVLRLGEP